MEAGGIEPPKGSPRPLRIATCACGAPLVATLYFQGKEFVCLECGNLYTFFGPAGAGDTPDLLARMEALRDEHRANVGGRLICVGMCRADCADCKREEHHLHASDADVAEHKEALAWLRERTGREFTDRGFVLR